MEWFVLDVILGEKYNEKFLAVRASDEIRFMIRVSSKAKITAGDTLTPVIDGYILNRNKTLTIKINSVEPFTINDWFKIKGKISRDVRHFLRS